jgi:hypothetical protein
MKYVSFITFFCIMAFLVGCATISEEAKYEIDKPVDCSTAEYDIKILEGEKASVGKRMLSGVKMVHPAAAVVGILRGDYKNRAEVTSGQYNKDIDAKIQEIKDTCGMY